MSHFIPQMLSESQTILLDTNLDQEQIDPGQKVSQSLIVDHTLLEDDGLRLHVRYETCLSDSIANSHLDHFCGSLHLLCGRQ
jgi:hypothetical protein